MTGNAHDSQELPCDVFETNGLRGQSFLQIARRIRQTDASLIAIDGLPGAGKSTLASGLSALLKIRAVHLDDYLGRERIGFTDSLRYEDLRRALVQRPVIVEGVCMVDVLDRLSLFPNHFIYIQAPIAERYLDQSHPLVRDVRAYTDRTNPVERANLVLARSECVRKKYETRTGRRSIIDACLMRHRSQISFGLAATGMISLAIGAIFIVTGYEAHDEAGAHLDGPNLSLVGAGLLTILTSTIWIFLARAALPRTRVHGSTRSRK